MFTYKVEGFGFVFFYSFSFLGVFGGGGFFGFLYASVGQVFSVERTDSSSQDYFLKLMNSMCQAGLKKSVHITMNG